MKIASDWDIILGSTSPRRRELLCSVLGSYEAFSILAPTVEEVRRENETGLLYVERLAAEKAMNVASRFSGSRSEILVVGADTVVMEGERVLEKPSSERDAKETLKSMSGREHIVATGVALAHRSRAQEKLDVRSIVCTTKVCFRELTTQDIDIYVASGEPMDKAGSYGAQGLAASFIQSLDGSYTNVVGLPLAQLVMFWRRSFPKCFESVRKA